MVRIHLVVQHPHTRHRRHSLDQGIHFALVPPLAEVRHTLNQSSHVPVFTRDLLPNVSLVAAALCRGTFSCFACCLDFLFLCESLCPLRLSVIFSFVLVRAAALLPQVHNLSALHRHPTRIHTKIVGNFPIVRHLEHRDVRLFAAFDRSNPPCSAQR